MSLANVPSAPEAIQSCLTQVCSALATLGDEAAGHSVVARGWLTKRDSVLRTGQPTPSDILHSRGHNFLSRLKLAVELRHALNKRSLAAHGVWLILGHLTQQSLLTVLHKKGGV